MIRLLLSLVNELRKNIVNTYRVQMLRMIYKAEIGRNVIIMAGFRVANAHNLRIGDNVYIGKNINANAFGGIVIEDNVLISDNCTIITYNHAYDNDSFLPYSPENISRKVVIGKNTWIGINVNITPGVVIGEGCVVGMGAVVSGKQQNFSVVAGNPAKMLKLRDLDKYNKALNGKRLLEVRGKFALFDFMRSYRNIKQIMQQNGRVKESDIFVKNKGNEAAVLYKYAKCHGLKYYLNNNYELVIEKQWPYVKRTGFFPS